ncbi:hypothetical protein GF339_15220 [candidate division KSB3 bacterium]|uniref:GerMN domain-containing protein n=1 Tax=candidate division KSB3 bacterium TaxID=2044937 RepID=A0A9D5Q7I6_9BACT|nr:hypothetical protein [candidate division KSB3 bacterium]MBD3325936.1 hypothetical protein [candidate division KSB3 bacterium]
MMSKLWLTVFLLTLLLLGGIVYLFPQEIEEDLSAQIMPVEVTPVSTPTPPDLVQTAMQEITLFIGDPETGRLVRTVRELPESLGLIDKITQTVEYLIHPAEDTRNEAIPPGTQLLTVFVTRDGIVFLNFSRHIQDEHMGGLAAELATIASLVNTLFFNFREISQVQLLVEEAEIETLAGHVDCRKPFSKMLLLDS